MRKLKKIFKKTVSRKSRSKFTIAVIAFFVVALGVGAVSYWNEVDFNSDGKINSMDLVDMFKVFGCPGNCPEPTTTPTPPQGQWTSCDLSPIGTSLQSLSVFNDSTGPEIAQLNAEGYKSSVGSLNCTETVEYFPQLEGWNRISICNSLACLRGRTIDATSQCALVDYEMLGYGPERSGGVPDEEKYNLPWAVQQARSIMDQDGRPLMISFSTEQLHREADERGFGWQNVGEVVNLLAPYGDYWLIQAADEYNNPNNTGNEGPILSQVHYNPGPEWRAEVQRWYNWIKTANPDIQVYIQLALHQVGPPEDPPRAELVLDYREWLVNPAYGPPVIDGIYISSVYSYPTSAGPEVADQELVKTFHCACGGDCTGVGGPSATVTQTPTPTPVGPTPTPVQFNNISLVEEGWTESVTFPGLTIYPGFYYRIYENSLYPCGSQGNHQFAVFDTNQDLTAPKHLFAKFPGGGVGFWYYNYDGTKSYYNNPNALGLLTENYGRNTFFRTAMSQEYANGLTKRVRDRMTANGDIRIMVPSYCSHDLYHGTGEYSDVDGFARYGYLAATEAIDFVQSTFAVNKTVTFGGSSGAANFFVAKDQDNIAGIVMDSFSADLSAISTGCRTCEGNVRQNVFGSGYACFCPDSCQPQTCCFAETTCMEELAPRIGFEFGVDEPHKVIEREEVDTPIYMIWNRKDASNFAPLLYENLHDAILLHNPGGQSKVNIDGRYLCITDPDSPPGPTCNLHVPTGGDADYLVDPGDNTTAKELVDDVYNWIIDRLYQ